MSCDIPCVTRDQPTASLHALYECGLTHVGRAAVERLSGFEHLSPALGHATASGHVGRFQGKISGPIGRRRRMPSGRLLSVLLGELEHVIPQGGNAGFGHGVVDRGAEAAHRAVPLEFRQSAGGGTLQEGVFQARVGQLEGHVHDGAVGLLGVGQIEAAGAVDHVVEHGRLAAIDFGHLLQPANVAEQPIRHQLDHVDGEGGRGVQ